MVKNTLSNHVTAVFMYPHWGLSFLLLLLSSSIISIYSKTYAVLVKIYFFVGVAFWSLHYIVNTITFPIVIFFFGLFATGILSIWGRSGHCRAVGLLFDITDIGDEHFDSDVALRQAWTCTSIPLITNFSSKVYTTRD